MCLRKINILKYILMLIFAVLKYKDTKAGMPDFSWYNKTKMAKKITK
jgi:hypothetical protein